MVRFRNPDDGVVVWDDMVKGRIAIGNAELDDLVIARSDDIGSAYAMFEPALDYVIAKIPRFPFNKYSF